MLLKAFPGEILFSRLCRSLSVSGLPVQRFARGLGLKSRSSFHPFLTQHLTEIAECSRENATLLWSEQTLFPLWAWSMPGYAEELRQLTGPRARLQWFCHFTGNQVSQGIRLHFCPVCAREDAMKFGVPYWHCVHQIPGVSACYRHHCGLMFRPVPPNPHIAVEFYPDQCHGIIPCEDIEVEFAAFAANTLFDLAHEKENFDDNSNCKESEKIPPYKQSHLLRAKFSASLNELIRHLWDDNVEPVVSDKLLFLSYINNYERNIFPSWKLLLIFCLKHKLFLEQEVSKELSLRNQQTDFSKIYDTGITPDEIHCLMKKILLTSEFIVDIHQKRHYHI
ncbi:TniQ family protein [Enterobacter ludwigii]|uniref:TniQ family protein n=1 Tax=Enterobacter ludwigii TaxID=299767 RepID=UPI003F7132AB